MSWKARFTPQAWINDYAVDVDPEGPTDWELTDAEAQRALPEAQSAGADLDYLQNHPGAPDWARNWHGPFRIDLIDPDGLSV